MYNTTLLLLLLLLQAQPSPRLTMARLLNVELPIASLCSVAIGLSIAYLAGLCLYRLVLHPLARFPGPKLAALSNLYEFYHDVFLQGNFTSHIQELHEKYGACLFTLCPQSRCLSLRVRGRGNKSVFRRPSC
jgi:hypothetical protein